MRHLGHEIGRTTVQRILDEDGIHPAPERRKHMPWATFLKAYWGAITAMDFFEVESSGSTGRCNSSVSTGSSLWERCISGTSCASTWRITTRSGRTRA